MLQKPAELALIGDDVLWLSQLILFIQWALLVLKFRWDIFCFLTFFHCCLWVTTSGLHRARLAESNLRWILFSNHWEPATKCLVLLGSGLHTPPPAHSRTSPLVPLYHKQVFLEVKGTQSGNCQFLISKNK